MDENTPNTARTPGKRGPRPSKIAAPGMLSEAEQKRLERAERTMRNRRGRKNPAAVPARLTRTSAFAPQRRSKIDADIDRIFYVPGHSVIQVKGGKLSSLHRDLLYCLFRQPGRLGSVRRENPDAPRGYKLDGVPTHFEDLEVNTTWRGIIEAMNRKPHTNNLMTYKTAFEELRRIAVTIYDGNPDEVMKQLEAGRLPRTGHVTGLVDDVQWFGVELDSKVHVRFGKGIQAAVRTKQLVSLNMDVQLALKSDYAKSFWPHIDSLPNHTWVDESMLGWLVDRDIYGEEETNATRSQFRKDCRQAFDDLVRAGGLKDWRVEELGTGRFKKRKYHYRFALPRRIDQEQIELPLMLAVQTAPAARGA